MNNFQIPFHESNNYDDLSKFIAHLIVHVAYISVALSNSEKEIRTRKKYKNKIDAIKNNQISDKDQLKKIFSGTKSQIYENFNNKWSASNIIQDIKTLN